MEALVEKEKQEKLVKEKKEPKLTLRDLIRSANVDCFTEKVMTSKKIESRNRFSGYVYHRMEKVRVSKNRTPIGELSLEKNGCRFIYYPFRGLREVTKNGSITCYIETEGMDGKIYTNFVSPTVLQKAAKKFVKTYGIEPDENTMVAGFQYLIKKRGKAYRTLGRIVFFQVSQKGVFCRTMTELRAINELHSICENNQNIRFWIPPEDEKVGAIVEIKGVAKKILILFRSGFDEYISYDKSQYIPLVVGRKTELTEDSLREALKEQQKNGEVAQNISENH